MSAARKVPTDERLLTTKEAAEYVQLSHRTLENMRFQRRGIPFVKVGGSVRYRLSDLARFIDGLPRETTWPRLVRPSDKAADWNKRNAERFKQNQNEYRARKKQRERGNFIKADSPQDIARWWKERGW